MDIQRILEKVQELDEVCDQEGFYRDNTLEITTKNDVKPNFELRFFAVDPIDEE